MPDDLPCGEGGDINFDGRHVAHSFRDIIPLDKLKVISNILEGLVKLGNASS